MFYFLFWSLFFLFLIFFPVPFVKVFFTFYFIIQSKVLLFYFKKKLTLILFFLFFLLLKLFFLLLKNPFNSIKIKRIFFKIITVIYKF